MVIKLKLLFCVLVLVLPLVQLTNAQEKDLSSQFNNEWRSKALSLIEDHLVRHPKCELGDIKESIRTMRLYFHPFPYKNIRAYTFPDRDLPEPRIFINSNWDWNEKRAVITLIHEATHVTWRNGRWMCGPDRFIHRQMDPLPACRLFGMSQVISSDIDRDLEDHLRRELK